MKKVITIITLGAAVFAALSLSGCGHEHSADVWKTAVDTHWHECVECGEKYDEASHTFDEIDVCTECRSAVFDMDGETGIFTFDDNGSLVFDAVYDSDNALRCYYRYEIEYYDDGSVRNSKEYAYDVISDSGKEYLSAEQNYSRCENPENGDVFVESETCYNEDGGYGYYEYDKNLGLLRSEYYDTEGNAVEIRDYSYELNEDGEVIKETEYFDGVLYSEVFFAFDDIGLPYSERAVYYDSEGNITEEHRYAASGEEIE